MADISAWEIVATWPQTPAVGHNFGNPFTPRSMTAATQTSPGAEMRLNPAWVLSGVNDHRFRDPNTNVEDRVAGLDRVIHPWGAVPLQQSAVNPGHRNGPEKWRHLAGSEGKE